MRPNLRTFSKLLNLAGKYGAVPFSLALSVRDRYLKSLSRIFYLRIVL